MNLAQFLGLPMTAGPRDMPMGEDELGNVLYAAGGTPKGQRYTKKTAPANRTSVVKALAGQAKADPVGTMGGILKGAAQGAWDTFSAPGRAASGENVTMGDVADVAGMVSLPALAGKYDPAVANMGIRAYHGSPHDFDQFSMDKIGTGEGAQAYGHGLYFAESEGVARSYRDALADIGAPMAVWKRADGGEIDPFDVPGGVALLRNNDTDVPFSTLMERAQKEVDRAASVRNPQLRDAQVKKAREALDWLKENKGVGLSSHPDRGHMYEVDINADPADFLDWDAPLSEQPGVLNRLGYATMDEDAINAEALRIMEAQPNGAWMNDPVAKARIDELQEMLDRRPPRLTGQEFYRGADDDSAAGVISRMTNGGFVGRAQDLREAGIPGIKYRDAGSRGIDGAEGISRNYVLFDDSLIDIIRKYGLAGAAPLGAILGAQDDEKQRIRDFLSQ